MRTSRRFSPGFVVAAIGSLVGTIALGTGCSSAPDEPSASSSAALEETCQPLVKSREDVVCPMAPPDFATDVSNFVRNEVGTCAACGVGVASIVLSGGAAWPVVVVTGAGCYGCAAYINEHYVQHAPQYGCNLQSTLTQGCSAACSSVGMPFANATMGQSSTDVSCSCGSSRDAAVCCTAGSPSGLNGQRKCDPNQVAHASQSQSYSCPLGNGSNAACGATGTANGTTFYCNPFCTNDCGTVNGRISNWSPTPPAPGACGGAATPSSPAAPPAANGNAGASCPAGWVHAPNCKHGYYTLTCDADPGVYGQAAVSTTFNGANLMRCHPTQDGCGQVNRQCSSANGFTGCVKNFDGSDDSCR